MPSSVNQVWFTQQYLEGLDEYQLKVMHYSIENAISIRKDHLYMEQTRKQIFQEQFKM